MTCALCHQPIDLFDLDDDRLAGLPMHHTCAVAYRAEVAQVLEDATRMILAEPDPRRHRHHVSPPA